MARRFLIFLVALVILLPSVLPSVVHRKTDGRNKGHVWSTSLSKLKESFGRSLTSAGVYNKKRFFFENFLKDARHDRSVIQVSRCEVDPVKCLESLETVFAGPSKIDLDSIVSVNPDGLFAYGADTCFLEKTLLVTLNFANPNMFSVYGHEVLCQDEQQCLEFPGLALVREYLCRLGGTRYLDLNKSSFLVHNVYRYFSFAPCLYGDAFIQRPLREIQRNCRYISSQGYSATILPIVAPVARDFRRYRFDNIRQFLLNVLTGFLHARDFARSLGKKNLVIDGGRLGAGAFGNNIHLAVLMQVIAAACIRSSLNSDESFSLRLFKVSKSEFEKAKEIFQEFKRVYSEPKRDLVAVVKVLMDLIDRCALHPVAAQFGL